MGIRDRAISPRSPWQNALIGSIRRECTDHVIVFGERHLRRLLRSYLDFYNKTRTHLSLDKDAAELARRPGRWSEIVVSVCKRSWKTPAGETKEAYQW
jgi:transposase InsO family protein